MDYFHKHLSYMYEEKKKQYYSFVVISISERKKKKSNEWLFGIAYTLKVITVTITTAVI